MQIREKGGSVTSDANGGELTLPLARLPPQPGSILLPHQTSNSYSKGLGLWEISSAPEEKKNNLMKAASPKEDVLYATIDHGEKQAPRMLRDSVSDCDYAIVQIPSNTPCKSESNDDGADDYVLMS
ncbi:hypothetical protein SRHO_G00105820 [Serrasalmus rhombeus]